MNSKSRFSIGIIFFSLIFTVQIAFSQNPWLKLHTRPSSLLLEQNRIQKETPTLLIKLVSSSQTIASLNPKSEPQFDFTPGDSLAVRSSNGFYHIGDINLRVRIGDTKNWKSYSTAKERHPVLPLRATGDTLAAADLAPTLPSDIPLSISRYWQIINGQLTLRFVLKNISGKNVEIGAAGFPMVFNNILSGSLEQAHAKNVFYDPYIGMDAGYLQVSRLTGLSPTLLVLPYHHTPFEAYQPLLDDPTPRGITFEGFYEWMTCSKAFAENEWKNATPWNEPTSVVLKPGEQKEYGFQFVLTGKPSDIEQTLVNLGRPATTGIPGYILPKDVKAKLFLKYHHSVKSVVSLPEGAIHIKKSGSKIKGGWMEYNLKGNIIGRSTIQVRYNDGLLQTISYKVIPPEKELIDNYGNFLMAKQWFDPPNDTFHRNPSVISYDNEKKQQVTQEERVWIAGLSDEGGAGSWLGAMMKQLIVPDKTQITKLQQFADKTLWGQIQFSNGKHKYGVKKSLFYYEPLLMPKGTYNPDINYNTWSAWPEKEANSVGRSYNYPHVAAAWWVLYRTARNYQGLIDSGNWKLYLENAYHTAMAMTEQAPYYAQFGQMEGTIFYLILKDLKAEGMEELADKLEGTMKYRAIHWSALKFPFGSEMPWDSTGQEEVYIWSYYFGYLEKAEVTLNAILGYMPSIPGWAYNGNARRYWDFLYAGKTKRIERMIHHYGSELNAIPVLHAYRRSPDNFYLLQVGYGGYLGGISNIEEDGFAPVAFHAYPSTLKNDAYSGDYGSGFFGYALNSATYLVKHDDFGWLAFGGNISGTNKIVRLHPITASANRVFIQPEGLWIQLDAGKIKTISYNKKNGQIDIILDKKGLYNGEAYMTLEYPEDDQLSEKYKPVKTLQKRNNKFIIKLSEKDTKVSLIK